MPVRETLLDIAKKNGNDAAVGLIDETVKSTPEIAMLPARTIVGINYKTLVRTNLPSGSTFRNANQGTTVSKAEYVNRVVETFTFNPRWEMDKAVADRHEDGKEAVIALEADAQMKYGFQDLARQMYYGNTANGFQTNAKGFPGLIQSYDTANMTVDAGGTTDNTCSSVWFIKFGPQAVQWVYGKDGALDLSDVRTETLRDNNNDPFTGYVQEILAYPGLQVGSVQSVVRIKKLTADNGKGLTDSLIIDALAKFPVGTVPDVILMSRRSRSQLQKSRSVTIFSGSGGKPTGGTENVAPLPTESQGIRIEVTDAIRDTEPLTL